MGTLMGAHMRPMSMMIKVWLEGKMDFWVTLINISTGKFQSCKCFYLKHGHPPPKRPLPLGVVFHIQHTFIACGSIVFLPLEPQRWMKKTTTKILNAATHTRLSDMTIMPKKVKKQGIDSDETEEEKQRLLKKCCALMSAWVHNMKEPYL